MKVSAQHAHSDLDDPVAAVNEFANQLGNADAKVIFFFCSPSYDLQALGAELDARFNCPVVGCTSSGQIGPAGFHLKGITGVALSGGIQAQVFPISPLTAYSEQVVQVATAINNQNHEQGTGHRFGLLLVDGLSMMEERLAASLYQSIGDIPIIGGSAGDDLKFECTHVYAGGGQFMSNAAVFTVVESDGVVLPFKTQHFVPSDIDLVITEADPENRVIREINGEPAAQAYAEAVGLSVEELSPKVFSSRPLVLSLSGEQYIRSIQQVNEDLSLTCYCAIDVGLIVTIGNGVEPSQSLQDALSMVYARIPEPEVILGCDCIMRRLEYEQRGTADAMGQMMAENKLFGFSTYGEQFNGMHVNQTLTGVAIGG